MSSRLFNILKRDFQQNNNIIQNPTKESIRLPVSTLPIIRNDTPVNTLPTVPTVQPVPTININQTITPGSLSKLCKCTEIVVYSLPTAIKKGTNLALSAVYPRSQPSSATTKKNQDQILTLLGPNGVVTERRFIDIVPPPVPPPQNLQLGYVLYRDTNEPASRIPLMCNGLSTKKWDTS